MNRRWRMTVALATLMGAGAMLRARADETTEDPGGRLGRRGMARVVHRFDFDERRLGNLEDVPKYWLQLRPQGFPHFANGRFDEEVGHDAPPSLYLNSEGRNVALHYAGPDTRVRPNSEYRIEAWIRADRLRHARASLSAHFLDRQARPVAGSLVRSELVAGAGRTEEWRHLELYLPAAPPEAYSIGLITWVIQEPIWQRNIAPRRHIPRVDVNGGAWFDDITVFRLPTVSLTSSSPSNVLAPDSAPSLQVVLADHEDTTLRGILSIFAADGILVESHVLDATVDEEAKPTTVPVDHLEPGIYHARFDVHSGPTRIATRLLTFARLAARLSPNEKPAHSFGLVLDEVRGWRPGGELVLVDHQLARSLKLPVWTGRAESALFDQRREMGRFLHELSKRGFSVTAVLGGAPSSIVREQGVYAPPVLDLLEADPGLWSDPLAAVAAPFAGVFRAWQIQADSQPMTGISRRLDEAADQLRSALRPFISAPEVAIPMSAQPAGWQERDVPVDQVTVNLDRTTSARSFADRLGVARDSGLTRLSAFLPSLPPAAYRRGPRLVDWAQRLILARHAGADTVFVPQTWRTRPAVYGTRIEPLEEYLVFRTMADVIGDARPGPALTLADGVTAYAFRQGDASVLAIWQQGGRGRGRTVSIQLGAAARQIDLWGRVQPLARDETGRQRLKVSAEPTFVPNVDSWLVDVYAALGLQPNRLESGMETTRLELEMNYRGSRTVAGRLTLTPPPSWRVSPREVDFSLSPQRVFLFPVELEIPHNEPSGDRTILAGIRLTEGSVYLEMPLPLELGLSDVAVSGMAVVEDGGLVLRHVVTNQSSRPLSFRGSASLPGHQRQYRPFINVLPGETQVAEYRLPVAGDLVGQSVHLILREMNDGPRLHNLELVIP